MGYQLILLLYVVFGMGKESSKALAGESFYPVQHVTELLMGAERTSVLAKAIYETVGEGDLVVDLGAGSGILSIFAAMAGARKVFAVEINPNSVMVAREMIKRNNLDHKIRLVEGNAFDFLLDEKADVVISETISSICFFEQLIPLMKYAVKNLLKRNGKTIPENVKIMCAPIENEKLFLSSGKNSLPRGVLLPENQFLRTVLGQWQHVERGKILAEPKIIKEIDLKKFREKKVKGTANFKMERGGKLQSFFAFSVIRFSEGTELNPFIKKVHWQPRFFFLENEQLVEKGGEVSFSLEFEPCNPFSLHFSAERI